MSEWQHINSAPDTGKPFFVRNHDGEFHVAKIDPLGRFLRRAHQQRNAQKFRIINGEKVLESEERTFETYWTIWTAGYEFRPESWAPIPDVSDAATPPAGKDEEDE